MQNRRVLAVVIGAVLCVGAIAAAQDFPRVMVRADRVERNQTPARTTYIGNVVLTLDGVTVRANRAVLQGNEITLDGTVRLTLPKSAYVFSEETMPSRTPAPPITSPVPYKVEQLFIDTPIPQPWQPPTSNQR